MIKRLSLLLLIGTVCSSAQEILTVTPTPTASCLKWQKAVTDDEALLKSWGACATPESCKAIQMQLTSQERAVGFWADKLVRESAVDKDTHFNPAMRRWEKKTTP